jgi:hypothetical protein
MLSAFHGTQDVQAVFNLPPSVLQAFAVLTVSIEATILSEYSVPK